MSTIAPNIGDEVVKNQGTRLTLTGRGYRMALMELYYWLYFKFVYAVESVFGPTALGLLAALITNNDLIKRRGDLPQFARLRTILPDSFWKGTTAQDHYRKMVRDWHESSFIVFLYSRLGLPRLKDRISVKGSLPQSHPDWGKRPVIFAFMHTGSFGLFPYWLRSQGVRVASLAGGLPLIIENRPFQKIMELGNKRFGLEGVPHVFQRRGALRDSLRFLTPGNALVVALDGGRLGEEEERCYVEGIPIFLKQGAVRMAAQTNAVLIPISVRRLSYLRFQVHYHDPVPDELIRLPDPAKAHQHLVSELWHDLHEDPSDLGWTTLEDLAPALKAPRASWP